VVLVASRSNAKGATVVLPDAQGGKPAMLPFFQGVEHVVPRDVVEILAMQERLFGDAGLPRPDEFTVGNR
jgi:hypothetical protein